MKKIRTLVVDDDPVSRRLMQIIMQKFGECMSVDRGKQAIEAFRTAVETGNFFDLITLDVSMPGLDGTKVLMVIRDLERAYGLEKDHLVKILMVTAHADPKIVKTCIMAGCNDYIVKPYTKALIVEKLKTLGLVD